MFKMMECCSKPFAINCVNSGAVLAHQHQCKLEPKKTDDFKVPKIWAKTMESKVLHLKLMRGVMCIHVVRQDIKVASISSGYLAYLNLDKEMIV